MKRIVTLTMNPAIDVAYEAERMFHTRKIRARQENYDPGGGGINVARVIARLGGTARAYYLSGGATGGTLDNLLDRHGLVRFHIPIKGNTRISTAIYERETGKEFRLVPRGPEVSNDEWQECLSQLATVETDFLVASGSLPPGVPDDFYSQLRKLAQDRGFRLILDTSGKALREAVAGGGIFLLKPSLGEFQQLVDRTLNGDGDIVTAAREIVVSNKAEHVAVTMGRDGALLVNQSGTWRLSAVPVETRSTVGAGDSFLGAMAFALCCGREIVEAFRYGVAAGAAAVLSPGTDLCHREEVERLHGLVPAGKVDGQ